MPAAVQKETKEPTKANCRQPNLVWRSNDRFGVKWNIYSEAECSFGFMAFRVTSRRVGPLRHVGFRR